MASNAQTRHQSMVYLVTYSRANMDIVPDRETFARIIVHAFEHNQVGRVLHWVVALEDHKSSVDEERNQHYHMALKLSRRGRWSRVRDFVQSSHDICVNFSDNHNTYYSAYQYVTKEDQQFLLSPSHPDLNDPPSTEKAIASKKRLKNKGSKKTKKQDKRYSTFDVVEIIQQHKITTRLELVCLATTQKAEGKTKLAEFIANRGSKVVEEAILLAKEFQEAPTVLARMKKTRMEILQEAYDTECVMGCASTWMKCALDILAKNEIPLSSFCGAIYDALNHGRAKYRNIYIFGPANTGKTFMISPLKKIFKAFSNPATGTFAWVGAEEAEVVVLNDFRWHPSIIAWGDLLQLLEGDTVHLPAPKNFCKKDIEFVKDTPFFATADAPLVLVKGGSVDQANTQMMQVRWRFFNFWRQIPEEHQQQVPPCQRCFARLIIDYHA